jgi:phenylpyruvate tautomerase PptA (4-oxalocrotonate tautomerase family)
VSAHISVFVEEVHSGYWMKAWRSRVLKHS